MATTTTTSLPPTSHPTPFQPLLITPSNIFRVFHYFFPQFVIFFLGWSGGSARKPLIKFTGSPNPALLTPKPLYLPRPPPGLVLPGLHRHRIIESCVTAAAAAVAATSHAATATTLATRATALSLTHPPFVGPVTFSLCTRIHF